MAAPTGVHFTAVLTIIEAQRPEGVRGAWPLRAFRRRRRQLPTLVLAFADNLEKRVFRLECDASAATDQRGLAERRGQALAAAFQESAFPMHGFLCARIGVCPSARCRSESRVCQWDRTKRRMSPERGSTGGGRSISGGHPADRMPVYAHAASATDAAGNCHINIRESRSLHRRPPARRLRPTPD